MTNSPRNQYPITDITVIGLMIPSFKLIWEDPKMPKLTIKAIHCVRMYVLTPK